MDSKYSNRKNFETWEKTLKSAAEKLKKAWDQYEGSHQTLQKVGLVLSQEDFYRPYYIISSKTHRNDPSISECHKRVTAKAQEILGEPL